MMLVNYLIILYIAGSKILSIIDLYFRIGQTEGTYIGRFIKNTGVPGAITVGSARRLTTFQAGGRT
jgi:hypothetical protein